MLRADFKGHQLGANSFNAMFEMKHQWLLSIFVKVTNNVLWRSSLRIFGPPRVSTGVVLAVCARLWHAIQLCTDSSHLPRQKRPNLSISKCGTRVVISKPTAETFQRHSSGEVMHYQLFCTSGYDFSDCHCEHVLLLCLACAWYFCSQHKHQKQIW